ncbi:hypothetical protein PSHT_10294, partial [Puccinia striiformis]
MINLAINCNPMVITNFLHQAQRLMLFKKCFEFESTHIKSLVGCIFQVKETLIKSAEPVTPPQKASQSENNVTKLIVDFTNLEAISVNTKLEQYNRGAHAWDFPVLRLLAHNGLACDAISATVKQTFLAAAGVCRTGGASLAVQTMIKR